MARDRTRTFATLRRLRKLQEEERARETAQAHQALARGLQLRAALEQARRSALEEASARMAEPAIDASDMRAYYQYERHLARHIDRQDADNRKLDKNLAEQRRRLNEAAMRRKVVERLAELERERHAREAARQERIRVDEAAVTRALLAEREGKRT